MIYAIGLASDGTLGHFTREAAQRRIPVTLIDLDAVVSAGDWRLAIPDDGESWITTGEQRFDLGTADAYFCRIADLSPLETDEARALRWQCLTTALACWLDGVPGTVVNRPSIRSDNGSKPLHELTLLRRGFAVPDSVTSSDPGRLRAFAATGPTIVKAVCGARANSRLVGPDAFDGFIPPQGPVHLQRYVPGVDVRAHVCGSRVYAERIVSSVVDYRTAAPDQVSYAPCELPGDVADRLIACTRESGMAFAGWDFKVDDDGRHWCLEVNPMPGYDWYDRRCDGAISGALLELLAGDAA
jgi:glutathione synthase/RimK-type ligase-like ATP-grasp enzyme